MEGVGNKEWLQAEACNPLMLLHILGGPGRKRTTDTRIFNPMLDTYCFYKLSVRYFVLNFIPKEQLACADRLYSLESITIS